VVTYMPRIMSFSLTTAQFRARTKSVTRRLGWLRLRPGTVLCGVVKSQGLRKGEKVERLGLIVIDDVRREPLDRLLELPYGRRECALEGFEGLEPADFVGEFCKSHRCHPSAIITRIEYRYVEGGKK
jgi:hypothetical protein